MRGVAGGQLVLFLHVGAGRSQRENTGIFLCTAFLVAIPAFIGLAGDEAGTRAVAESLGVSYRQIGEGETAIFEHTASWFLLGADGTLQEVLGYALSDQDMEARLRARLTAAGS